MLQEVVTPEGEEGYVWGRATNGKIIVRLKQQRQVPENQKTKTFKGWQFEYPESDLKPAPGRRK